MFCGRICFFSESLGDRDIHYVCVVCLYGVIHINTCTFIHGVVQDV